MIKVPKFLVKDDLLEMTTYSYLWWTKKPDGISVKFYRTVQTPYSQTISLTWIVEVKDDRGNVTRRKKHKFDLQDKAEK